MSVKRFCTALATSLALAAVFAGSAFATALTPSESHWKVAAENSPPVKPANSSARRPNPSS